MADLIGEDDFAELQSMILESIQLEAIVNLLNGKASCRKKNWKKRSGRFRILWIQSCKQTPPDGQGNRKGGLSPPFLLK